MKKLFPIVLILSAGGAYAESYDLNSAMGLKPLSSAECKYIGSQESNSLLEVFQTMQAMDWYKDKCNSHALDGIPNGLKRKAKLELYLNVAINDCYSDQDAAKIKKNLKIPFPGIPKYCKDPNMTGLVDAMYSRLINLNDWFDSRK